MEFITKLSRKNKFYILLAILIAASYLFLSSFNGKMSSFELDGVSYSFESMQPENYLFRDSEGNDLILEGEYYSYPLVGQNTFKMEYKGEESVLEIKNGLEFYMTTGGETKESFINYRLSGNELMTDAERLMNEVLRVMVYRSNNSVFEMMLINILLIGTGLLSIMYPEKLWMLRHFMDVKGGEPTSFYIITSRISGAILIFLAYYMPIKMAKEIFSRF